MEFLFTDPLTFRFLAWLRHFGSIEGLFSGADVLCGNCIVVLVLMRSCLLTFLRQADLLGDWDMTWEFPRVAGRVGATYVVRLARTVGMLSCKRSSTSISFSIKATSSWKLPPIS